MAHPISDEAVALFLFLLSLLGLLYVTFKRLTSRWAWLFLLFGLLSSFLFGNWRFADTSSRFESVAFGDCSEPVTLLTKWESSFGRFTAEVETKSGERWKVYADVVDTTHQKGSVLYVSGYRQGLKTPVYPYQFDERTYYRSAGIYGKWYLDEVVVIVDDQKPACRDEIIALIRSWPVANETRAFYLAMLTGERGDIESADRTAFSRSGLVHILAVSGLHVGLIVAFVSGLFFHPVFKRTAWGRWLVWSVSLLALWTFVYISGSSASVLRAAIMFSAVATAKALQRSSVTPEAVWISAYLLLIIHPYEIFSLGFQLSYLAVFSIVYGHAFVQQWLTKRFGSSLRTKVISLLSVSFWAQLSTSPVTLFHFHQFPNYFLFSNLIFLPFVPILLAMGIALCVWSAVAIPPLWLFKLVDGAVRYFNAAVHWVASLPGAVTENIYLSQLQAILGVLVFVLILIALYSRRIYGWAVAFLLMIFLPFAKSSKGPTHFIHHFQNSVVLEWEEVDGVQVYMSDTSLQSTFIRQTQDWRYARCGRSAERVFVSEWEFPPLNEGSEDGYYGVSANSILQEFRQSSP